MSREVKITFQPLGRSVYALPGTCLMEAAARAGIILRADCGGIGACGKCVVVVREGHVPAGTNEMRVLGARRVAAGERLACCARVGGPLLVDVPAKSLLESGPRILASGSREAGEREAPFAPVVLKTFCSLVAPRHGDTDSDLALLLRDREESAVGLEVLRTLPGVLRSSGFAVTTVRFRERLIAVEPGDTTAHCYGLALDVGSTTMVAVLVDLATGAELEVAVRLNAQTKYGDDVVSRISMCRENPRGVVLLRDAVLADIQGMLDEVLEKRGIASAHVYRLALAGNTTMQQLLCGIDPSALGELPFVPVFKRGLEVDATALGLRLNPAAHAFVFPQIGGFVGGDTVAGILAAGLDRFDGVAMLVDVGTNGEIVLAHNGAMTAVSVAAGPAFEGARIVRGMRASAGAIEKVAPDRDGDLLINIIGNCPATGLCGTALIDAVAEMLRCGVIDVTGRIMSRDELPSGLSPRLAARVQTAPGGEAVFVLAYPGETADREPLFLHQKDIRELQLANAAIRAGINLLLKHAGLAAGDLQAIMLAGAFGNYIRRQNALRIGMLPHVSRERIRFVGNAALLGAKRALLSEEDMETAQEIRRRTRHIDLSLDPGFQEEFGAAMLFPES